MFLPFLTNAQEQLGLRLGNYSGVSGININPATPVANYPLNWEVNLGTVGFSFNNNYAFIHNTTFPEILRNTSNIKDATQEIAIDHSSSDLYFDFYNNGQKKFVQQNTILNGPSALVLFNDWSVGLFANARSMITTSKIPAVLGFYTFDGIIGSDSFSVGDFEINLANWTEIGVHVGKRLNDQISVGTNVKFLQALDGFYFNNTQNVNLIKSADTLYVQNTNIEYGFAHNFDSESIGYKPKSNGNGFSIDFGANYAINEKINIGFSMIDFGVLNFNKNAQAHLLNDQNLNNDNTWLDINVRSFETAQNEDEFVKILSEQAFFDETITYQSNKFNLLTPAAFVLQADIGLTNNLYVNALAMRRQGVSSKTLKRPNIFAVTPRFESRWVEIAMPLTLLNDQQFRYGLALRLGFLTIGSEDLSSLFVSEDFNGTDLYASLKINPFSLGFGNGNKKSRTSSRTSKTKKRKGTKIKNTPDVSCPKF